MDNRVLALTALIGLVVVSSGCSMQTGPELQVSDNEIDLEGNETEEFGFRVKNNNNRTLGFNVTVKPQGTNKTYIKVLDEGQEKTKFELGDAEAGKHTSWKYTTIKGMPENIDPSAVQVKLQLTLHQEGLKGETDTKEVPVVIRRD